MPSVLIVGAGINGLCTGWALVRRGWQVTILEAGTVPNPHAASSDHHRLIRRQYSDPGYAARVGQAFAAWDRLWKDLGAQHYVPRGMLALSREAGDWTDRCRAALEDTGQPHEVLPRDTVARRFPTYATDRVRYGLFSAAGGALLSDRILVALAAWLTARGARIETQTPVAHVDPESGSVTAGGRTRSADAVILAAGVGLPVLDPAIAQACTPCRVTVVYANPPAHLAAAWAEAPCWTDLGGSDDLWGMPPMLGLPAKLGVGALTVPHDPAEREVEEPQITRAILEAYADRFTDGHLFEPVRTHVNYYLRAPDEAFLLRRSGRIFSLTADSGHGFKFGALTGEDVAEAVDGGDVHRVAARLAGREGLSLASGSA